MARKYEMKRRARRQEETRRRITEAAVRLHQALGPAKTTISAIAERAGVQRLTVYRHFPDERALLSACSSHYAAANPPPDPEPWTRIPDPEDRLRRALAETKDADGYIYGFDYGDIPQELLIRDLDAHPLE